MVAGQAGVGWLPYLKLEEMSGSWVTREGRDIINLVILGPVNNFCHLRLLLGKKGTAVVVSVDNEELSEAISHRRGGQDSQKLSTRFIFVEQNM